jgi:hypothetical protein
MSVDVDGGTSPIGLTATNGLNKAQVYWLPRNLVIFTSDVSKSLLLTKLSKELTRSIGFFSRTCKCDKHHVDTGSLFRLVQRSHTWTAGETALLGDAKSIRLQEHGERNQLDIYQLPIPFGQNLAQPIKSAL